MRQMRKVLGILLITLSCGINLYSQQPFNWARYESASPVLRGALEELRKEGYKPLLERVEPPYNFGDLFVTTIIPVRREGKAQQAGSGILGILVIFVKVPLVQDLQIVQVVQLRYYKTGASSTTVEGQIVEITEKSQIRYGEKALVLSIDGTGKLSEKSNKLIFAETGRSVTKDCENLAMNAVQGKCSELREKSHVDWIRCTVSGWLWAKRACWHFRE